MCCDIFFLQQKLPDASEYNYLVAVFLRDHPSVDSMQYTRWSAAEVSSAIIPEHQRGCNDTVLVCTKACEACFCRAWTRHTQLHSFKRDMKIDKTAIKHSGGLIRLWLCASWENKVSCSQEKDIHTKCILANKLINVRFCLEIMQIKTIGYHQIQNKCSNLFRCSI